MPPSVMQTIRRLILADDPAFRCAREALQNQQIFILDGDKYQKTRHAAYPEDLRQWLDRREIYFHEDSENFATLFSPDLGEKLSQEFPLLKAPYTFLCKAITTTL